MKKKNNLLLRFFDLMKEHLILFIFIGILVAVSALANLAGTYMIRPIVNTALEQGWDQIVPLLWLTGGMYLTGVVAAWAYTQLMAKAAQQIVARLRSMMFAHMHKLPVRYFDTHKQGDIMARFTSDVDVISDALNNSFANVIQSFIQWFGTLVILFVLSWKLSLLVLVFYLVMFVYILNASKKSRQYFKKQQSFIGKMNGFIQEMIFQISAVHAFNHESASLADFEKINSELYTSAQKALGYSQTMVPMIVTLSYVNYALVAVAGGLMAYYGMFDVGALASYLIFVRQTAAPINQFVQQMTLLLSASSGLGRIFEFMDEPEETNTGVVTLAFGKEENGTWQESDTYTGKWVWRHPRSDGSMELVPLHGDVAFENVTFGYDPARPVLKDFSLKVDAGDTVALVGSTGAGKTTISNLLNRFYDIDAGTIALDGIDIRLIELGDLRRSIALVLQESKVFSRSIKDNIGYGDLNAADAEIEDAARLSFADSYISRLPRGYETMIDEKGDSLSKGQIQLLAIARAALSNPPVLILDEATSSIDTRTESLIDKGMQQLMKDRTTFVIAHRLSTIQNADRIVVLDKGRIAESGSHEELLKQKGMYYRLWTGQAELD